MRQNPPTAIDEETDEQREDRELEALERVIEVLSKFDAVAQFRIVRTVEAWIGVKVIDSDS